MEHIAIDLGGKKSQICVRDAQGKIVEELRCETDWLDEYLKTKKPGRVILETCTEAFLVANQAKSAGHEVRVVPGMLVRTLGVGARKTKTDRRDAQALSEVSTRIDLPSVHIPSQRARELRAMCGARDRLLSAQTQLINFVRAWLRGEGLRIRSGATETYAKRVRELGKLPSYIERELNVLDTLKEQIAAADKELKEISEKDPVCKRLMTVPGVGPLTSVRFFSTVDKIDRFDTAHKLESYLGLAPGENSSSERQRKTSITKAGPSAMRWVLVQAAWVARTKCNYPEALPLKCWAEEIKKRRGSCIATVAMARKLAGILFAIWRDGTVYQPKLAAKIRD
jgi:transposase